MKRPVYDCLCPMKLASDRLSSLAVCEGDRCMWFLEETSTCAIAVIAKTALAEKEGK